MPIDQKILEIIPEEKFRELEKAGYKIVSIKKEEQFAFTDLEPAKEWVQLVEKDLKSYHWKKKEVERLKLELSHIGTNMVAQSGIESSLPKPTGINSNPVHYEVQRRERLWKTLNRHAPTVDRVERAMKSIIDEKELTILELILEGKQSNEIAKRLGISRQTFYEIKNKVIKTLAWAIHDRENKEE